MYDTAFAAGCVERIAAVRERFTWENVLAPLTEFCRNPRPAADRLTGTSFMVPNRALGRLEKVQRDVALVKEYMTAGGAGEVARRATGRVLKKLRGRG
jgi:hypothetical protein